MNDLHAPAGTNVDHNRQRIERVFTTLGIELRDA